MKKYNLVLIALIGIFLISITSSLSIYPSETKNITLDFECINYSIEGNTSFVNITCNNTASIGLNSGYPIESFNITFYGSKDVKQVSVGSSNLINSGGSLYIPKKKNNTTINQTNITTTTLPVIEDTDEQNYEEIKPKENYTMRWIIAGIFVLIVVVLLTLIVIKLNKNKEDNKNE